MRPSSAYVVQFPHPGAEHRPAGNQMAWNTGRHARKFMETEATYRIDQHMERTGRVVFWGEWEGPSTVVRRWIPSGDQPRFLHHPFWELPRDSGPRQNTDPWVFGSCFRYSNCKQLSEGKPTAMQRLTPGSVILYGSTLRGNFVLDTVFVVADDPRQFIPARADRLGEDDAFFYTTLDAINSLDESFRWTTFTLYRGATPSTPVTGMYCFTPCLPSNGDGPRFARPPIHLPGVINPASRQAPAGTSQPRTQEDVTAIWQHVTAQVLDQGLSLATRLELPSPHE